MATKELVGTRGVSGLGVAPGRVLAPPVGLGSGHPRCQPSFSAAPASPTCTVWPD